MMPALSGNKCSLQINASKITQANFVYISEEGCPGVSSPLLDSLKLAVTIHKDGAINSHRSTTGESSHRATQKELISLHLMAAEDHAWPPAQCWWTQE